MRNLIFFDSEVWVEKDINEDGREIQKLHFRLVCAEYVRRRETHDQIEQFVSKDINEFWDWVVSKVRKKSKITMIAHNADFDLRILDAFTQLKERGYLPQSPVVIDTNRVILSFRNQQEKKTIRILDSYNWFKTSVEKMGKMLGYPKLDPFANVPEPYKGDWNKIPDNELIEYCKRDVEVLRKFILEFFDWWYENDLGVLGKTIASCAFNAFRHRFMKHKILIHWDERVRELERKSYRGGRSEMFYRGKVDKVYYLDINSMYPYVMKINPYPCRLLGYVERIDYEDFLYLMKQYLVISKVLIQVDKPLIGVKKDFGEGERLIFPIGRFWAVLTSPELEMVLKYGEILKVAETAWYTKDEGVFTDFIDFFYNERLKAKARGDEIKQYFYKILMNSLYGKFGQKIEKFEEVGQTERIGVYSETDFIGEEEMEVRKITTYCFAGKKFVKFPDYDEGTETNVAIASFVTAYARCYLTEMIIKAGWENVFYCDTDSLLVNEKGYQNLLDLVSDRELGKLKLEEVGECVFYGAKNYKFLGKWKLKGVKNPEESYLGEDDKYFYFRNQKWYRFRSLLRNKQVKGGIVEEYIKKVAKEYKKALVEKTRVKPYILWEI